MNRKGFANIILVFVVTALAGAGVYFVSTRRVALPIPSPSPAPAPSPAPSSVVCTQEAKQCPDGSYVGRTGPNCEFSQCPVVDSPKSPPPLPAPVPPAPKSLSPAPVPQKVEAPKPTEVKWNLDFPAQVWKASGNPPACPAPLVMLTPVDASLVNRILYPGQYRGGNYKPHGGFRFVGAGNAAAIKAPMDAYVFRGSRYIESGEVQYLFFFISPCGIMYKFDHLLTLAPKFQAIADKFPPAKPNDSRTTDLVERIMVTAGEVIAAEVGTVSNQNVFFDFGVYDLRAPNAISQDPSWAQLHSEYRGTDFYGICFFDVLPKEDATRLRALPTGVEGTVSDYCK